VERDLHLVREIGEAARAGFRKVFEEWDSEAYWPVNRTFEAQIAAASLGYKPLYWDPWGQDSARLCAELRQVISADAVVDASDVGLVIFRPNVITPIREADLAFYQPHGESVLTAVRRVCRTRQNGELLGYGVRSADTAGAMPVRILNDQADLFARFMSNPRRAEDYARERLLDIATYIDADLMYLIGSIENTGSS
jgi:hypothetical protein